MALPATLQAQPPRQGDPLFGGCENAVYDAPDLSIVDLHRFDSQDKLISVTARIMNIFSRVHATL